MSIQAESALIWIICDKPDLCKEFCDVTANKWYPAGQYDLSDEFWLKYHHIGINRIEMNNKTIFGKPLHLKYFCESGFGTASASDLSEFNVGVIIFIQLDDIESVKHAMDAVRYVQNLMPYTIVTWANASTKSWHSKVNILNDANTLTYNPEDKASIKNVWKTIIRRFELGAELEQRFLDCIESKV